LITALDTNVLIDFFGADPTFGHLSNQALRRCIGEGGLVACDVVWAEVAAWFPSPSRAAEAMDRLGVRFGPVDVPSALSAGSEWKAYRRHGGARERMIADFLIGAHALAHADRLLSRDRGFYRTYFKKLQVLDPTKG
jgi:predicted nucleic acid-binding protein